MPKMKTHRGAAKRLRKTGSGKLKRNKAYKSHILTKKSPKTKMNLRKSEVNLNKYKKHLTACLLCC